MAGRWVMAAIQTSFAIMPAAVYWFGGLALAHGSHAVSIPMLVSFTTLQTRLFFPVGSLLGVGLDVQTSLALFDRIFEYLDEPIDIEEKPDAIPVGKAGDVAFDHVWFRYGEDWTLEDVSFTVEAGTTTALVGRPAPARRRSVPRGPALRRQPREDHHRRRRPSRSGLSALSDSSASSRRRRTLPCVVRENLRFAKPAANDEEIEVAAEAARIHHVIAALPEVTTPSSRARLSLLGRREAADRDRAHDPAQPAHLVLDEATSSLDTETERFVRTRSTSSPRAGRRSRSRTGSRPARRGPDHRPRPRADRRVRRHQDLIVAGGRYSALAARDAELGIAAPLRASRGASRRRAGRPPSCSRAGPSSPIVEALQLAGGLYARPDRIGPGIVRMACRQSHRLFVGRRFPGEDRVCGPGLHVGQLPPFIDPVRRSAG